MPRNFFLVPRVGVGLLGWRKVEVDRNWALGDMSKGMLECRIGLRVRIFGIDTKNRACREGGTGATVGEEVGVRYDDDERYQCKVLEVSGVSASSSSSEASPCVH